MGFLKRIKLALKVPPKWIAALDKASRNEFDAALVIMNEIYAIMSAEIGSKKVPEEYNILYGFLLAQIGRLDDAISMFKASKKQVISSKKLSEKDKMYLVYYCDINLNSLAEKTNGVTFYDVTYDAAKIAQAAPHLRKKFPIHPDTA